MKLTTPCAVIAPALAFVCDAIAAKPPVPILASIVAEAGDGRLSFRATDLDRDLYTAIACGAEAGSCVLDGRLAAITKTLPKDAEIAISAANGAVTVTSGAGRWRLPALPVGDFPLPLAARLGATEVHCSFELSASDALALLRPACAASDDDSRFYLMGIHMHPGDDGRLIAVATDGIVLAKTALASPAIEGTWPATHVIMPVAAAEFIAKLAKGADEPVRFRISAAIIDVASGTRGVTSKLINATYPDYPRILPREVTASAEADAAALLRALDRLAAIAAGDAKLAATRIEWAGGDSRIALSLPRMAGAAEDTVDAATNGTARFAVSVYKLKKMVSELTGKTVTIAAGTPGDPVVITDPADESFYSLVSLMRA